jgi:hypothetical protein
MEGHDPKRAFPARSSDPDTRFRTPPEQHPSNGTKADFFTARLTIDVTPGLRGRTDEKWIRFGRIVEEHVIDRERRIVSFAPGSIFAFVRRTSNDYGTVASRIDILGAVGPGVRCSRPGGEPAAPLGPAEC